MNSFFAQEIYIFFTGQKILFIKFLKPEKNYFMEKRVVFYRTFKLSPFSMTTGIQNVRKLLLNKVLCV